MSCKSALSNSIKSNSDQPWIKSPTTTETNIKFAGEEAKDRLYEPKHKKKLFRVLTVVAYVFSVSLAAIMLSLYYIFIWNPNTKVNNRIISDGNNGKVKCNCHEIVSEALKQMKTEDALSLVSPPTYDTDPVPSLPPTTEDSAESLYDEASSETKLDDNNIPMDNSILNYESDTASNETQYI